MQEFVRKLTGSDKIDKFAAARKTYIFIKVIIYIKIRFIRDEFVGIYLNPGSKGFCESLNSEIYIDKTGLIDKMNRVCRKYRQKFVCFRYIKFKIKIFIK